MQRSHYIPWIYNFDFKVSPEFIRFLPLVLLMVQKSPSQPPGMVQKLCKEWDKLPTSTGERRISEPPTVSTRNCHGSGSGDPQRWWHWLRARLWLKSLGFRNRCVLLNKSIFGRHLVLRRHLFLANICIHQGKLIDKTHAELSHFSCFLEHPSVQAMDFFRSIQETCIRDYTPPKFLSWRPRPWCNIPPPNGLIDWLAFKETKHTKMFRFCWKQNLPLCQRFLECAAIKAIKEELRQDSLMLSKIPSWERSRIPSLQHLRSPWFSGFYRLVGHPDCQFPGNYSWMQRLRGNTVIRVIDSGSNPANQETGVVSRHQGITLCVWLMKESANLIPAFSCSLVAGGTPHKLGQRIINRALICPPWN